MRDLKKDILELLKEGELTLIEIAKKVIHVEDKREWKKLIATLDWLESCNKIEERSYPGGKITYSLE
jgi:hypothetical protein